MEKVAEGKAQEEPANSNAKAISARGGRCAACRHLGELSHHHLGASKLEKEKRRRDEADSLMPLSSNHWTRVDLDSPKTGGRYTKEDDLLIMLPRSKFDERGTRGKGQGAGHEFRVGE